MSNRRFSQVPDDPPSSGGGASSQMEDKGFQEKEMVIKNMTDDLSYVIVHVRNATDLGGGDALIKAFSEPDPFVVIQLDG